MSDQIVATRKFTRLPRELVQEVVDTWTARRANRKAVPVSVNEIAAQFHVPAGFVHEILRTPNAAELCKPPRYVPFEEPTPIPAVTVKAHHTLTPRQCDHVRKMLRAGRGVGYIAAMLRVDAEEIEKFQAPYRSPAPAPGLVAGVPDDTRPPLATKATSSSALGGGSSLLTREQEYLIVQAWLRGLAVEEVADLLGHHPRRVLAVLTEAGYTVALEIEANP